MDVVRVRRAMKNSMSRRTMSGTLASLPSPKSVPVDCMLLDRLCCAEEEVVWSSSSTAGGVVVGLLGASVGREGMVVVGWLVGGCVVVWCWLKEGEG